jgi:hypothetical protein
VQWRGTQGPTSTPPRAGSLTRLNCAGVQEDVIMGSSPTRVAASVLIRKTRTLPRVSLGLQTFPMLC